jgi:hypothetical protein
MVYRTINPTAMRIEAANSNIIEGNDRHEYHHEREVPKTSVAGIEETNTHYISNAGTPVTIEDCCTAEPSQNAGAACCEFLRYRMRE